MKMNKLEFCKLLKSKGIKFTRDGSAIRLDSSLSRADFKLVNELAGYEIKRGTIFCRDEHIYNNVEGLDYII